MCRRTYLRPINIKLDKWMLAMVLYASGNKDIYMTPLTMSHLFLSYHPLWLCGCCLRPCCQWSLSTKALVSRSYLHIELLAGAVLLPHFVNFFICQLCAGPFLNCIVILIVFRYVHPISNDCLMKPSSQTFRTSLRAS